MILGSHVAMILGFSGSPRFDYYIEMSSKFEAETCLAQEEWDFRGVCYRMYVL